MYVAQQHFSCNTICTITLIIGTLMWTCPWLLTPTLLQIDGIELMSELLQNEQWSHIPIIGKRVCTA